MAGKATLSVKYCDGHNIAKIFELKKNASHLKTSLNIILKSPLVNHSRRSINQQVTNESVISIPSFCILLENKKKKHTF